jgi:hypothetical protein
VGAVKRVRTEYAKGIARKSGYVFPAKTPELGYVAVAPQHWRKGLSHSLVTALLAVQQGGLFSTTYDKGMMKTLTAAGFAQKGHEWLGRKHQVSLWLRGTLAEPKGQA